MDEVQRLMARSRPKPSRQKPMNKARRLAAAIERAEQLRVKADVTAEQMRSQADQIEAEALAQLEALRLAASKRFGRDIPSDAGLLDVLDAISIEPGDVWRWNGRRSNLGRPVLRGMGAAGHDSETSVMRYLGIAFGVITKDQFGVLYPEHGDTEDVNPFHRVLRQTALPVGNIKRFGFVARSTKSSAPESPSHGGPGARSAESELATPFQAGRQRGGSSVTDGAAPSKRRAS